MLLIQPLAGRLSDRVGRKPLMIFFGIGATLFTYPIFIDAGADARASAPPSPWSWPALVIVTGYTSINAIIKAEMFPADIRALGRRLAVRHRQCDLRRHARNMSLCTSRTSATSAGSTSTFRVLAALSLIAYVRMRETKTASL